MAPVRNIDPACGHRSLFGGPEPVEVPSYPGLRSFVEAVGAFSPATYGDAIALSGALMTLAETDLSTARIAECHANARLLLDLYGIPNPNTSVVYGVWGADGDHPLRLVCGQLTGGTVASGPQGTTDPDRAVALSIQSRLLTEDLAQDAIAAVERAVGLAHFKTGSETGRMARDLATYCRQAARDAFEQRAGRIALSRPGPLSGLWHG